MEETDKEGKQRCRAERVQNVASPLQDEGANDCEDYVGGGPRHNYRRDAGEEKSQRGSHHDNGCGGGRKKHGKEDWDVAKQCEGGWL